MTKLHLRAVAILLLAAIKIQSQTTALAQLPPPEKQLAHGWQNEALVTASTDGFCRWWTSDGTCRDSFFLEKIGLTHPAAAFTRHSNFLLLQISELEFGVWDVPARAKIWVKNVGGAAPIRKLAISENNHFTAVATAGELLILDSVGTELARFELGKTPATALEISNRGMVIVHFLEEKTGGRVSKIWGLDARQWQLRDAQNFSKKENAAVVPTTALLEKTAPTAADALKISSEKLPEVVRETAQFAVAVGTFSSETNARRRLADVKNWGFAAAEIFSKNGKWTVVAARLPTHDAAWKLKKSLEEKFGIHAAVVRQ